MNKVLKVVTMVGSFVVSVGVGAVVANVIKYTTPADTKRIMKLCIGLGSFIVSGLCAVAASDEFEKTMDKIRETIEVWSERNEPEQMIFETGIEP